MTSTVVSSSVKQFDGLKGGNMDKVDRIMAYEDGSLSDDDTIKLFQELIDSGEVWTLQGSYGRMARALILGGYCHE